MEAVALSWGGVGVVLKQPWFGSKEEYVLEVSQHPTCLAVGAFLVLVVEASYVGCGRRL